MNDEALGVKRDGTASDKHNAAHAAVPPPLANVVLDELDWALDARDHRFARYADDCNIFVKSQRAGERVMQNVTRYLSESLRLTVNAEKSAVDRPRNRKFLGFTVNRNGVRIKVADKAIEKLKNTIRDPYVRWCGRGRS